MFALQNVRKTTPTISAPRSPSRAVTAVRYAAVIALALGTVSGAHAQLQFVQNVPGTFINIKNLPGRIALNLAGDDEAIITTTVGNAFYPAGTVVVGNNGGIGFDPPTDNNLGPIPGPLPNLNAFGGDCPALLPYWADIGNHVGNVYWIELNNNKLIVQWEFKRFECCPLAPAVTFQCQINGNSRDCVFAQFLYESIETAPANGGENAAIGTQFHVGLTSLNWSDHAPFAVSNSTVLSIVCIPTCKPDFDGDGFLTGDDFDAFIIAYELGAITADYNNDGFVTGEDFDEYVSDFETGC